MLPVHAMLITLALPFMMTADAELMLRLAGGTTTAGRLEVYYDGQWGTICDDNWDHSYCTLVCDQLGFSGGLLVPPNQYGQFPGIIWLDGVTCHGHEIRLDECSHDFWGRHNCQHNEDVACVCDDVPPAVCDVARHHLRPWNPAVPWIGRVEVKDENGMWGTICDDLWQDAEAHVMCTCLGFTNASEFRALWSRELAYMSPTLPMIYDSVTCSSAQRATKHNLYDCQVTAVTGRCDVNTEAAGVACGPLPQVVTPSAPEVQLTCEHNTLGVCFMTSEYMLNAKFLSLLPACSHGHTYDVSGGVCYNIDMKTCTAKEITTDASWKNYCYDVTYSQYDTDPATLLIDNVWSRRACCSVAKNGSVVSSFGSHIQQPSSSVYVSTETNFTLTCYTEKTFTGTPLEFPANVTRGQELFCRVTAHAWDERLNLVVPECEFSAFPNRPPTFGFLFDKCPTSGDLGVSFFSFDIHNWGMAFQTPKFQGYESLYLSCAAYVCDVSLDGKPYCDRSCGVGSGIRKKRAADGGRPTPASLNHVSQGPLLIQDSGFGPLLTVSSSLHTTHLPGQRHQRISSTLSNTVRAEAPRQDSADDSESGKHIIESSVLSSGAASMKQSSNYYLGPAVERSEILFSILYFCLFYLGYYLLITFWVNI